MYHTVCVVLSTSLCFGYHSEAAMTRGIPVSGRGILVITYTRRYLAAITKTQGGSQLWMTRQGH